MDTTTSKRWPIYQTHPHCSGPCNDGQQLCMTPEACQTGQHNEDKELSRFGAFNATPAVALGLVGLAALAALAFADWQAFAAWLRMAAGVRL